MTNKFGLFFFALNNEVSIDKEVLLRLGASGLGFTPVRAIKLLPFIRKYRVSFIFYCLISFLFLLILPVFLFVQFLKFLFRKNRNKLTSLESSDILLVANGRADALFRRVSADNEICKISVNRCTCDDSIDALDFLSAKDGVQALWDSFFGCFYFIAKSRKLSLVPYLYVSYNWFLAFRALIKIKGSSQRVFFSNHYDRWAVLFDGVFQGKDLRLLQHGILPENLKLAYPLKNISCIYSLDAESEERFKKLFDIQESVSFQRQKIDLELCAIESDAFAILVIGQPHSIKRELELLQLLKTKAVDALVFIKPHPLFGSQAYDGIGFGTVISDKTFFPKVDVAVCFESTLGVEYEHAGVDVVWWGESSPDEVCSELLRRLHTFGKR